MILTQDSGGKQLPCAEQIEPKNLAQLTLITD